MRRRPVQIASACAPVSPRRCRQNPTIDPARRSPPRRQPPSPQKQPSKENEMGIISGRRLLLGAVIASSVGIGYAIGAQPHMEATVGILQSARAELAKA